MDLPKPGEIVLHDCRSSDPMQKPRQHTRIIQWNIERGYKLQEVIAELQRVDADVIGLQEVDWGCERSGRIDTGLEIAKALRMHYAFLCEFEELHSPLRDMLSQGGGVHGNAILSRYPLANCRAIEHRHHPVDWEAPLHSLAQREPRHGRRLTLAATVQCPSGPLLVYSCHLEVFCGMLARIAQFADVLRDSRQQTAQGQHHQAILGDLNTMAHGIARLSPHYCCDHMRLWSLGSPEALFWHANLFCVPDPGHQPERDGQPPPIGSGRSRAMNQRLLRWGVPEDVCRDALNPGFRDPFDPVQTVTLDNPQYRLWGVPLMQGKLDWLLLRRLYAHATSLGNHNYSASDHKWLCADVSFE